MLKNKNMCLFLFISLFSIGYLNASDLKSIAKRQVNPCQFIQCSNGGTCVNNYNLGKCICPFGFFGVKCQFSSTTLATRICGNLTCINGGVCVTTGLNAFSCFCPPNFSGKQCEISSTPPVKVEQCQPNSCPADVPCLVLDGRVQCFCFGNDCQPTQLPPNVLTCTASPCLNNGNCLNVNGRDQCFCIGPWTGDRCETPVVRRLI